LHFSVEFDRLFESVIAGMEGIKHTGMERSKQLTPSEAILVVRKQVLDLVQASFGDSAKWPIVRAQLLRIFGDRGWGRLVSDPSDSEGGAPDELPSPINSLPK
jgi:hypothetical protein